ncbi:ABC transporter ATP-binding protein [Rubritalea tangerina]|uniref:ABC transporter ATP-binding protein n=1 Tax=Rubritalea tangerina TaxID=430798 RepID=UPI00362196BD
MNDVNFEVANGACVALMGTSGSGKTTLMEAICGLRQVTQGSITLDQINITYLRPGERQVALVPQDNVLFPHLTVRQHLSFGPEIQRWSTTDIAKRVETLANELGISHLLDRKPTMLSGGESKRVALGRALATRPKLLCLDEALTGLDDSTHSEILELLQHTISSEQITTLHITHSLREAQELAQEVIHISEISQPLSH